jgi:preprotein translocase subunit SecB
MDRDLDDRALGAELTSMPSELTAEDIADVHSVIAASELRSIEYYEMSARRYDAPKELVEAEDGQLRIAIQQRSDSDSFGIRLNATLTMALGEANVSVAGEYALTQEIELTTRAVQLFANEVGVMTVFPYLREAVASMTGRVFKEPLHLQTISRGDIVTEVDPREG